MLPQQFTFFTDPKSCKQIEDIREYFFSIVASSLLQETKFYAASSECRDILCQTMEAVCTKDPEFLLQTAYYVRNKMYIRSTPNFIIAFSILNASTKPFLKKYFNKTILIPGDLIEVCKYVTLLQYYQNGKLNLPLDKDIRKHLKFPKMLQKLVAGKLVQFNEYQLGKQCSDASRKKNLISYKESLFPDLKVKKRENRLKKIKAMKEQAKDNPDIQQVQNKVWAIRTGKAKLHRDAHDQIVEETNIWDTNFMNLKDIIQMSHISEPKKMVMAVLGYKYPKTEQEFQAIFNDQQFEADKAGKRMQIPIPVTWDRELSKGNGNAVWEQLLQKNQVPYLALLRNLRNILKAKVSDDAHQKVVDKLSNPQQVQNSKVFPLQFFSSLNEINNINKPKIEKQKQQSGRTHKIDKKVMEIEQQQQEEQITVDEKLLGMYSAAIERAIKISVDKNLDTIPGVTYILIDVSGSMSCPISGGKKYGSVNKCMDCAFVLGHMIRIKCEASKFYLFAAPLETKGLPYTEVQFQDDTLLQGIKRCQTEAKKLCGGSEMIGQTIFDLLLTPKVKADNIVVLSDMMVTQGFQGDQNLTMDNVISRYVQEVNNNCKFFFMDISSYGKQVGFNKDLKSKNCFIINGMSDNVLKYIATAGAISQIDDIVEFSKQVL